MDLLNNSEIENICSLFLDDLPISVQCSFWEYDLT